MMQRFFPSGPANAANQPLNDEEMLTNEPLSNVEGWEEFGLEDYGINFENEDNYDEELFDYDGELKDINASANTVDQVQTDFLREFDEARDLGVGPFEDMLSPKIKNPTASPQDAVPVHVATAVSPQVNAEIKTAANGADTMSLASTKTPGIVAPALASRKVSLQVNTKPEVADASDNAHRHVVDTVLPDAEAPQTGDMERLKNAATQAVSTIGT